MNMFWIEDVDAVNHRTGLTEARRCEDVWLLAYIQECRDGSQTKHTQRIWGNYKTDKTDFAWLSLGGLVCCRKVCLIAFFHTAGFPCCQDLYISVTGLLARSVWFCIRFLCKSRFWRDVFIEKHIAWLPLHLFFIVKTMLPINTSIIL